MCAIVQTHLSETLNILLLPFIVQKEFKPSVDIG